MVAPDTEITMEANPGTFERERFRGYRAAGVTRLSLGVQSFDDAMLAAVGRVHGSDEARRALAAALEIFPTVNADLMYALPGQSPAGALAPRRAAVAAGGPPRPPPPPPPPPAPPFPPLPPPPPPPPPGPRPPRGAAGEPGRP